MVLYVHPASVFEPGWEISYPVHAYEFKILDPVYALRQVGYKRVFITGFFKNIVENFKIIITEETEVINFLRVKPRKIFLKITGDKSTLFRRFIQ